MSNFNFDPYAPDIKTSPAQQHTSDFISSPRSVSQTQQLVEYEIPDVEASPYVNQGMEIKFEPDQEQQPQKETEDEDPLKLKGRKKYRSSRSVCSTDSSRSSMSGYSHGHSPLDDPTYAPPPEQPIDERRSVRSKPYHMPAFEKVTHSGHCMARISLKSLIIKKWRPVFWICYGDSRIIFFRSKSDFDEWATNPLLNLVEREELVKLDIDFKDFAKKPGVKGYRAASLHMKDYSGRTGLLHTFKLEEWMYYGPIILGAFSSKNRRDVHSLLVIMREIMKKYKQNIGSFGYHVPSSSGGYDSDRSHRSVRSAPQNNIAHNRPYPM